MASLKRALYLLLALVAAAYIWLSFVQTEFNLYPLFHSGERAGQVMGELLHPDLSWHERGRDGEVLLDPLTHRPEPGTLRLLLSEMNETIEISLAGTILSMLLSFPLAFLAAGNLTRGSLLGRTAYWLTRGVFNVLRAFPPYVLAIIFVVIVGTGPFPGVLAIALHSIGMLGKLFAEAIEGADPAPIEAMRATGAGSFLTVWYGILPQVLPQFMAFSFYRWDMNIRMTIILGIVGAGGIGFLMEQYIRQFQYARVSTCFLIILVAVTILDWASGWLREKLG
jgi:phosphonate transport system permease protein